MAKLLPPIGVRYGNEVMDVERVLGMDELTAALGQIVA